MGVIATVGGTFLAPGVSANARAYDKPAIEKAVRRMEERLNDPGSLPITMLSYHGAGDDSTKIVGRINKVALQSDGSATWEGALADNAAGRDIAALIDENDGRRILDSVSIRGWWVGPVRTESRDGKTVETADDIEIDGVDFTKTPGVSAARLSKVTRLTTESVGAHRTLITESVEVHVADEITDQATTTEADTKAHVQAAWEHINQTANQKPYTAAQLSDLVEATISIYHDAGKDSLSMSKHGVDPNDIDTAATQVGSAAKAAAQTMGTDNDAGCGSCGADTPDGANYCPQCGATQGIPTDSTESTNAKRRPVVAESKSTAPKADAKATESTDGKPAGDVTETAKPDEKVTETVPVTETKPVTEAADVTETVRNAVTEAVRAERQAIVGELGETMATKVTEAVDALRSEIVTKYGPPRRAGLVADESAPEKPVEKMTTEEFNAYATATWDRVLPQAR